MVNVELVGRLGNNLFQYALGRILAEELGLELTCGRQPQTVRTLLPGRSLDSGASATLEDLAERYPHAHLHVPGRHVTTPLECHELAQGDERSHTVDLAAMLANRTPRQIRLRGWFQRYEYYAPYHARIRGWFQPVPLATAVTIGDRDVLLNIRRGADYGLRGWTVPLSYYDEALDRLGDVGRIFICGTCLDQQVRDHFARRRPIYHDGAPVEQFAFMMRFRRLVLANSTFSWWAGWLSTAETIVAPRAPHGRIYAFTGFGDVDLHMRDARYQEMPIRDVASYQLFTRDPLVDACFEDEGRTLSVRRGETQTGAIPADDSNRALLQWLAARRGPILFSGMARRYHGSRLPQIMDDCLKAGLLTFDPRYLDRG